MLGCQSLIMAKDQNQLEFTGVLLKDGKRFVSLCLEVDVASQGKTPREAKRMLAEALTMYVETCFENGIPYLRPVPQEDDPRMSEPQSVLETFPVKVEFKVHAIA
jgi:predicted RNase H-like HicB family nuclease